jgi:hypothetical protein
MADGKVVEGDFQSLLTGCSTIMPILTGACSGKYASRIIDHSWLSLEYET